MENQATENMLIAGAEAWKTSTPHGPGCIVKLLIRDIYDAMEKTRIADQIEIEPE